MNQTKKEKEKEWRVSNPPLRNRDKNLINNWYIACLSEELPENKAISRQIYDYPIVLFRDQSGIAVAQQNRCLHRLTQMETGCVKNGTLACPYHGWTYNPIGQVINIPAEGPNYQIPKLKNKSFPCVEKDGVVWVWTGSEKPEKEPDWQFPYYHDHNWIKYFMITDFEAEVTNLCENFMDVPHTVYVHSGWFRNQSQKTVPMNVKTESGRVKVTYNQENDQIGGLFNRMLNPKGEAMTHTDEFIFPNLTRVDYSFGNDYGFVINSQNTPVSSFKSRTYTYIAYRLAFGSQFLKPFFKFYTRQVIKQDVEIMAKQSASLKLDFEENYRSSPADLPHLEIEKLRQWGREGNNKLFEYQNEKEGRFWI